MAHGAVGGAAPRLAALACAAVLAAWALSQLLVMGWQAADAAQALAAQHAGLAPLRWDLGRTDAVVAPGSEGLEGARQATQGLEVPASGVPVDLSLRLAGRTLPLDQSLIATLHASVDVPARIVLLGAAGSGDAATPLGQAWLDAGATQTVRLQLAKGPSGARAGVLRLRIERASVGALQLHTLEIAPFCAGLPQSCAAVGQLPLAPRATPERFLERRDALQQQHPFAAIVPTAVPTGAAPLIAVLAHSPWVPRVALLAAAIVLAWCWRARGRAPRQPLAALLALLLVPLALLATGWPREGVAEVETACALALTLVAAWIHPGTRRDWQLVGDAGAWRSGAKIAGAGLLLLALLWALAPGVPGSQGLAPERLFRYLPWALVQQWLLLAVITPRLLASGFARPTAALLAGAVFALLHLPNLTLMVATFCAGIAFAASGIRHSALLPLALAHWLLGSLLVWIASPWLLRSAEVGGRFLLQPG